MSSFTQISMPESPKQKRLNPEFKKEKTTKIHFHVGQH